MRFTMGAVALLAFQGALLATRLIQFGHVIWVAVATTIVFAMLLDRVDEEPEPRTVPIEVDHFRAPNR